MGLRGRYDLISYMFEFLMKLKKVCQISEVYRSTIL